MVFQKMHLYAMCSRIRPRRFSLLRNRHEFTIMMAHVRRHDHTPFPVVKFLERESRKDLIKNFSDSCEARYCQFVGICVCLCEVTFRGGTTKHERKTNYEFSLFLLKFLFTHELQ